MYVYYQYSRDPLNMHGQIPRVRYSLEKLGYWSNNKEVILLLVEFKQAFPISCIFNDKKPLHFAGEPQICDAQQNI